VRRHPSGRSKIPPPRSPRLPLRGDKAPLLHGWLARATLVAALLVAGTALAAGAKKPVKAPVTAPAEEAEAKAEGAEAAPEAPAAAAPKRPVVAPGTKVEALPELVAPAPVEATEAAAPAVEEAPPPPPEFQGMPEVAQPEAAAGPREPVAEPAEARSSVRVGDFQYVYSVKPGRPKAHEPVELNWRIQEVLHIPDPFLGDRRPATDLELVATVSGPEKARAFEVHPLGETSSGVYGIHFTPGATGAYEIQLARADGKSGHRVTFMAYVGVEPPAMNSAARGVNDRPEELIAGRGPDDRDIEGVMKELGKRWMALERAAGTPRAAEAAAAVREQVAKIAGKAPKRHASHAVEFDDLAKLLADRADHIAGDAPRAAALDALQEVQEQACLRCHVRFRFGLAESVRAWPAFVEKKDLDQPSARERAPRGRGPVAPR